MTSTAIPPGIAEKIFKCVAYFEQKSIQKLLRQSQNNLVENILEAEGLNELIHSHKERLKDGGHLKAKLERKYREKPDQFDYTPDNLLMRVNDLVGVRLLHLHSDQFEAVHRRLLAMFNEWEYVVLPEHPFARVWDEEAKRRFEALEIRTEPSDKMYTSVHYVIKNSSRRSVTMELQVRTLAEELWGEVDHLWNYPEPVPSKAMRDQLASLARSASGCNRLVDAVFKTGTELGIKIGALRIAETVPVQAPSTGNSVR